MKPVTNILLVLALVCYVFLPFFEISFQGALSGFGYTAGLITDDFSVLKTLYALIPFISCFLAIGVNSLKGRYWGIAVAVIIALGLVFFYNAAGDVHLQPVLTHDPDVMGDRTMAQGFEITGLGLGYQLSLALGVMSIISAIISVLPFKFNRILEEQIDHRFEEGKKHLSEMGSKVESELHSEISKIERRKKPRKAAPQQPLAEEVPPVIEGVEVAANSEPDAAYMPKQEANPDAAYMPQAEEHPQQPATTTDDDPNSRYMPKP